MYVGCECVDGIELDVMDLDVWVVEVMWVCGKEWM